MSAGKNNRCGNAQLRLQGYGLPIANLQPITSFLPLKFLILQAEELQSYAPSLKFLLECEIYDVTKYDVKMYPKATLTLLPILQATHSHFITHNFFKTFRTRSQQIKLES